jgi:hypothetical protein
VVTGQKISKNADVYAELDRAMAMAGGTTPCRESNLFTAKNLTPGDVRIARQVCDTCPIIADCRAAGQALSKLARANSVMGGIAYDNNGQPVEAPRRLSVITPNLERVAKNGVEAAA